MADCPADTWLEATCAFRWNVAVHGVRMGASRLGFHMVSMHENLAQSSTIFLGLVFFDAVSHSE